MRGWAGRAGAWMGTSLCACLVAGSACLAATRTLALRDGSVLSVWELQLRSDPADPGSGGSAIAYSISDASGTLTGTIAPTGDPSPDRAPVLAIDPTTGSVVAAWSRFDGADFKIAYARFDQGSWADFHYLTFGSGSDFEPRIGSSRTGSYLFWIAQGSLYLYAPIDLSAGHLLAVPRGLRLGFLRRPDSMTQGGSMDGPNPKPKPRNSSIWEPGGSTTEGGSMDGPNPPNKNKDSVWGVGSDVRCRRLMLVIPDALSSTVHVVGFANGTTAEIGRRPIPLPVPDGFAEAAAAAFLHSSCF